jgi:hypothetical protein
MATRKPLVILNGVAAELPPGDAVAGAAVGTLTAGSGLAGGGDLSTNQRVDVSLAAAPSGLIFVGTRLGLDGAAQASGNAALSSAATAQASGNAALSSAATALASGNAAQSTANTALASGLAAMPRAGGTFTGAVTVSGTSYANTPASGIKTATFNSQLSLGSTAGTINIDWTAAQNYIQPQPTSTITYTFTAPPGVGHFQLFINNTSTAQTINWPGTLTWLGSTWAGANSKRAVINLWYDGTNYYAIGTNQA